MKISKEARKVLRSWARDGYYVYLRILDYRFYNPDAEFRVHWRVSVEYRGVNWRQFFGEGFDLSEIIVGLGEEVPRKAKVSKEHYAIMQGMSLNGRPRKRPPEIKSKKKHAHK